MYVIQEKSSRVHLSVAFSHSSLFTCLASPHWFVNNTSHQVGQVVVHEQRLASVQPTCVLTVHDPTSLNLILTDNRGAVMAWVCH